MNNENGGQSSFPSGANAWNEAAAKNAKKRKVATKVLTSAQKQQRTVADIARQKVLEAYRKQSQSYQQPTIQHQHTATTVVAPQAQSAASNAASRQATPLTPRTAPATAARVSADEWRRYHSAWQEYYQKYYGEYYGRAAKEYVARERLKYERTISDSEIRGESDRSAIVSTIQNMHPEESVSEKSVADEFKAKIQNKVAKRAKKMRKSRHFIPITIGLSVLILGLLFQYNQVIIANAVAYMSPGGSEVNDISAIDPTVSASVHENPTLMIPKLNVEVPVVFGSKNDVNSMSNAMSNGVAHFMVPGASAKPGEIGNFVVSGHSAGNIYQQSDYKFIFSGLTRMGGGDLIYMDYNSQRYTYRVTGTRTVDPSDVGALRTIANDNNGKPMITLITCTPLGTSKYRLLVYGEQIHPSYEGAPETETPVEVEEASGEMPKNDDSPFEQFWKWLTGQS